MTDIRVKDLTEASVPGADYYLLTDSATDGVKKVKTTNVIAKADIGLGNVDNTSDASKPVSTATQAALDLKQDLDTTLTSLSGKTETGSGNIVLAIGPTLVAPILSTPTTPTVAGAIGFSSSQVNFGDGTSNHVLASLDQTQALTNKTYNGNTWTAGTGTLTLGAGVTLAASANATVSGTNTGDQTITLTGDVTGSGTGSFATAIGATKVTSAMLNADVFSTAHSWSGVQTFTNPVVGTQTAGDNSTKAASTAFVQAAVVASGGGDMLAANNLSDVANVTTARNNLDAKRRFCSVVKNTNALRYGSFIRGADGWAASLSTPGALATFSTDFASNAIAQQFSRAKVQIDASATGKNCFVCNANPAPISLSKRYKVGFFANGYASANIPSQINVDCYDVNSALISTLTVSVTVALTASLTASIYTAIISQNGGTAPAWPANTVAAVVRVGYVSAEASEGMHLYSMFCIPEDEWPGSFAATVQNYGGGTHEAVSDGTYLYVLNHSYNEIAKFDSNLKRVASISCGDYPHDLVILGGDLWVACQDAQSIQRINLGTFTVSNTYAILSAKNGYGLATDGTSLWLGAGTNAQGTAIISINPADGTQSVLSTDVNTGAANVPVKYYSGSLWGVVENAAVKRINPSDGATIASITPGISWLYGLGVGGGYVFASGAEGVVQIDPATNTVVATYLFRTQSRGASNIEVSGGRAYATTNVGVVCIDYVAQTMEEVLLDAGTPKWVRALPNGQVAAGTYSGPWVYLLES